MAFSLTFSPNGKTLALAGRPGGSCSGTLAKGKEACPFDDSPRQRRIVKNKDCDLATSDKSLSLIRRPTLRLRTEQLVKVNDQVGLHPEMTDAGQLLEGGRLAIVQAVGYPNPNRSHFESMAIWHTARFDPEERGGLGWIGRGLDGGPAPPGGVPAAVFVGGGQMPVALRSRRSVASGLTRPEDFVLAGEAKARLGTKPKDDLLAFVRRSALDGYATADRMAEVVRAGDGTGR